MCRGMGYNGNSNLAACGSSFSSSAMLAVTTSSVLELVELACELYTPQISMPRHRPSSPLERGSGHAQSFECAANAQLKRLPRAHASVTAWGCSAHPQTRIELTDLALSVLGFLLTTPKK